MPHNDKYTSRITIKLFSLLVSFFVISCNSENKPINSFNNGKYLNILNTRIYYEEYGTGMPLVLLSGGGIHRSIRDYEKCIPALAKHFRVIAPDTPGQGRSEVPDSLSYHVLTEFASRIIDSLKLDSAYVMGWSDGGIVGILLAAKRSDKVKKVIAVGANNGKKGFALPPGVLLEDVVPMTLEQFESTNKALVDN